MSSQNGCLKKRRRRALAKVAGLSMVPYEEETDTFFGIDLHGSKDINIIHKEVCVKTGDCVISISQLESSKLKNKKNITFASQNRTPYDHNNTDGEKPSRSEQSNEAGSNRHVLLNFRALFTLRCLLIMGTSTLSFPWSWNKETQRIDKWSPRNKRIWWTVYRLSIFQTVLLTGYQVYTFYLKLQEPHETFRGVFMAFMGLYWYITCVNLNFFMYKYREKTRHFINTLLALNETFCGEHNSKTNYNVYEL